MVNSLSKNKNLNIIILLIFVSTFVFAQNKSGYYMLIGDQGLHAIFNGSSSKPIMQQNFLPYPIIPQRNFHIGSSCISDSATGKLLLVSNGYTVYDTLGNIIQDGDSLVPPKYYNHNGPLKSSTTNQASLILPKGNNGLYYLFIPTVTDSMYTFLLANQTMGGRYNLFQYHIIDLKGNNGLGKVIAKNIPLMQNAKLAQTGMQACRHANGIDWWLLKQGINDTNVIYRFLVTADTIIGPDSQFFDKPKFQLKDINFRGQSAFSTNGNKYAFTFGRLNTDLFVADFDRCTGLLSNPKNFVVPIDSTTDPFRDNQGSFDRDKMGIAFSSNDSFIYVATEFNIHQLELNNTDTTTQWYNVQHGSDTTLQKFEKYSTLHRGIDGRIYIGKQSGISRSNSVIDYPNNKGAACGFCRKCLRCDTCLYWTVAPANMPDFTLGVDSCFYWPLSNVQLAIGNEQLSVYPNPTNSILFIECSSNSKRELYNTMGQLVASTFGNNMDVGFLARGFYFVRVGSEVKRVVLE
jgi:hypothetical protein